MRILFALPAMLLLLLALFAHSVPFSALFGSFVGFVGVLAFCGLCYAAGILLVLALCEEESVKG